MYSNFEKLLNKQELLQIELLPTPKLVATLYKCIEELCVVDVAEAREILGVNRSRIYQIMNNKNTLKIGAHKYVMANVVLNDRDNRE